MENAKVGAFEGFIGTIIKPNQTMKKIVARPTCLIPVLCMAIFSGLRIYANFDLYYNQSYELIANSASGIAPSTISVVVISGLILSIVTNAIVMIAVWLILSCFLTFIVRIFDGDTNFKQVRAITAHSYYIYLFSVIVQTIGTFVSQNATRTYGLNLITLFPNVTDVMTSVLLSLYCLTLLDNLTSEFSILLL